MAEEMVFAPKNYGLSRFCVDYRKLKNVTVRDSFLIPRMDECRFSRRLDNLFNAGHEQLLLENGKS